MRACSFNQTDRFSLLNMSNLGPGSQNNGNGFIEINHNETSPRWSMARKIQPRNNWTLTPGPGHYSPDSKRMAQNYSMRAKTGIHFTQESNRTPGPGTYDQSLAIKHQNIQYSMRPKYPLEPCTESISPGPGHYEARSSIESKDIHFRRESRLKTRDQQPNLSPMSQSLDLTTRKHSPNFSFSKVPKDISFVDKTQVFPGPGTQELPKVMRIGYLESQEQTYYNFKTSKVSKTPKFRKQNTLQNRKMTKLQSRKAEKISFKPGNQNKLFVQQSHLRFDNTTGMIYSNRSFDGPQQIYTDQFAKVSEFRIELVIQSLNDLCPGVIEFGFLQEEDERRISQGIQGNGVINNFLPITKKKFKLQRKDEIDISLDGNGIFTMAVNDVEVIKGELPTYDYQFFVKNSDSRNAFKVRYCQVIKNESTKAFNVKNVYQNGLNEFQYNDV